MKILEKLHTKYFPAIRRGAYHRMTALIWFRLCNCRRCALHSLSIGAALRGAASVLYLLTVITAIIQ